MHPVRMRGAAGDTPARQEGGARGRGILGLSAGDEPDSGMREPAEVDAAWSIAETTDRVDQRA